MPESIQNIIQRYLENPKLHDPRTLAEDRQAELASFFASAEGVSFVFGLPLKDRILVYILMYCSSGIDATKLLWRYHGNESQLSAKGVLENLINRQSGELDSRDESLSEDGGTDDRASSFDIVDGPGANNDVYSIDQLIRLHVANPSDSAATKEIIKREDEFASAIQTGTAINLIIGLPLKNRLSIYCMIPIWAPAHTRFVLWRLRHAEQNDSAIALLEKLLGRPV